MRFKTCPKCKAQCEDEIGVPCWSCGHVDDVIANKDVKPGTKKYPDLIDPSDFSDPYVVQGIAFKVCGNCGAHCESGAGRCWDCGTIFKTVIPTAAQPGDEGSAIAERKNVPFADLTAKPPEEKKKTSIGGSVGKLLKETDHDPSEKLTAEEKAKEHELKKERRLILFHCPRCNGYFKVIFRKVQSKVKCPECKGSFMKIPYFCVRCKKTEDFSIIGSHVCSTCNLEMILDPNFE
ncbi:MAG: hypothetical protein Q6353_016710 [Candidatus Sigynarchaeum springense]